MPSPRPSTNSGASTVTPFASIGGRNSSISAGNWADSGGLGPVGRVPLRRRPSFRQDDAGFEAGQAPQASGNPALTLFLPKSAISVPVWPRGPSYGPV